MPDNVRPLSLDHIVLRSTDPERTLAWYCDVLGLQPERLEEWRRKEVPFPSLRVDAATVIDIFSGEGCSPGNLDHLCLVYARSAWERLQAAVDVERGPSQVWGALGTGTSVYTRDPDGTLVELRWYPASPEPAPGLEDGSVQEVLRASKR